MTSRFHHSKFVKTGLVFAVCTWGKAEERQGSVKSMTRPACQKPRPCLPSTLTEWVMPRTELAERQEAVTPADSFLDWSVACAILTCTTAFTQSLRLLANQETKVRGCIIWFDADWHKMVPAAAQWWNKMELLVFCKLRVRSIWSTTKETFPCSSYIVSHNHKTCYAIMRFYFIITWGFFVIMIWYLHDYKNWLNRSFSKKAPL